jgi:hypothetical protein
MRSNNRVETNNGVQQRSRDRNWAITAPSQAILFDINLAPLVVQIKGAALGELRHLLNWPAIFYPAFNEQA